MTNNYLYCLKGTNGKIEVYNDRIIITRPRIFLKGSKTIPINSIKSVQFKKGGFFVRGFIQFGILGGIEARGGVIDAGFDENTVVFSKKYNNNANKIKEFIESKIFNENTDSKKFNSEKISATDEIIKYKKLLDEGIINEDEFNMKKKELLKL